MMKLFNQRIFFLLAFVMCFLYSAGNKTYYYKVTANAASPTGAGTVYVSESATENANSYSTSAVTLTGNSSAASTPSKTFYFFAKTDNTSTYNYIQWKSGTTIISEGKLNNGKHNFSKSLSYASTTESSPTTYTYTPYFYYTWVFGSCDGTQCTSVNVSPAVNKLNTCVTMTATLADGYYVKYWINKNTGEIVESSRKDSNRGKNPWTFNVWEEAIYEPVIGNSWVTASSANTRIGTTVVSPSANYYGDQVTLCAIPNSGSYNVEWRKKGNSTVVSTDNPFTLTVTEQVEYVATFVQSANTLTEGYYRFRSPNPMTTNSDIALVDNLFNMHAIVGSVSSFLSNSAPAIGRAQNQLAQDINLKTAEVSSTLPNTVIYVKKVGTQYDFYVQGTHIKQLSTGKFFGENAGIVSTAGTYVDLARAGNSYLMSLTISAKAESYNQTESMGPFYFTDRNGKFTVLQTFDNHSLWQIEPITEDDNYFAIQPQSAISVNGKYYATTRLSFPVKIPSGSQMKVYGTTQMPNSDGGQATLQLYQAGATVPAGMPIVIESTSLSPEDNKLLPTGDPTSAISTNTSYSISTALYNNYGAHRHDFGRTYTTQSATGKDDVPMSGDQVGYFDMNPDYTDNIPAPVCYSFGVNDEGKVGFWNQVASQTKKVGNTNVTYYPLNGNTAYSTKPCALFEDVTTIIDLDKNEVNVNDALTATITSVADGASIQYSLDGGNTWTAYTAPINVPTDEVGEFTILAKASKNYSESETASANYSVIEPYITVTLAQLVSSGVEGKYYNVTGLAAAYACPNESGAKLYCKDNNGYNGKSVIGDGETDYVRGMTDLQSADWDQSNWIALEGDDYPLDSLVGKNLTNVKGVLRDKINPRLELTSMPTGVSNATVSLNSFVMPNFFTQNPQTSSTDQNTYFFVAPKPMEVANIYWAMWNGSAFVVPPYIAGRSNQANLDGGAFANFSEYPSNSPVVNDYYNFIGLVKRESVTGSTLNGAAAATVSGTYVIYPLTALQSQGHYDDVNGVVTSVADLRVNNVTEVARYNVAGMPVNSDYRGVVIVVMSDGMARKVVVR